MDSLRLSVAFVTAASLFALVGCVPVSAVPDNNQGVANESQPATPSTDTTAQDNSPRLILPVTGGPPVIGIPLGGGMYLPVTVEAPTLGIPLTP